MPDGGASRDVAGTAGRARGLYGGERARCRPRLGESMADPDQNLGELIVADDDPAVRDLLSKVLRKDFTLRLAPDGTTALALLEDRAPVAILVDEMMPGARGTEVLERARELYPHSARLLMTAAHEFTRAVEAVNRGEIHRFFAKPLRPVQVRHTLVELCQRVRADELLRARLDTLLDAESRPGVEPIIRVLAVGSGTVLAPLLAAAVPGRFEVTHEERPALAPAVLMQRVFDVAVWARQEGMDIPQLTLMARCTDEHIGVIEVDPAPTLPASLEAHTLGLDDYLPAPLPAPDEVRRRVERAALRHVATRDLKRLTAQLIEKTSELHRAYRRTEDEQVKVLNAMVQTLEARDSYTAGHTARVAGISVRLAETLGFPDDAIERVRRGALLHDVGKVGVRDSVLLKPGRLTQEEFDEIKKHPGIGYDLLAGIQQFHDILPIVRSHHEKLLGGGYPDDLQGEAISDEVRCVAVADVLDALTSTRPYRDARSVEEAFAVLDSLAGHHLDAGYVAAVKALHEQDRLLDLLQLTDADAARDSPTRRALDAARS